MILSELQYFPPVIFFSTLYKESYVYLDVYEIYRKMSFRNRCLIAGAEGIISLSIPLQDGRNQQLPIKEVLISKTENWQARHWKSIQSAYNRSPFFEFYEPELAELFKKPVTHLADWNLDCLRWVKKKLEWPVEIRLSEAAIPHRPAGINDLRHGLLPKNYYQGNSIKYRQVFEERTGFFPNLSVLDLLFNTGRQAADLLATANG